MERLEYFKKPLALAVISTLGLTACANQGEPAAPETTQSQEAKDDFNNKITRKVAYSEDGSRTIYLEGSSEIQDSTFVGAHIYQFCDGKDLVEETLRHYRVAAGVAISRTVQYPACADGKLTEADFQTK